MYFGLDCTQLHALAAPCMGLAPKVEDVCALAIFCAADSFCLAATLRYSRLAMGAVLPLEYLLDTAMSDEGNELYSQYHRGPTIPSRCSEATANELASSSQSLPNKVATFITQMQLDTCVNVYVLRLCQKTCWATRWTNGFRKPL